jgi:hypothetical protein
MDPISYFNVPNSINRNDSDDDSKKKADEEKQAEFRKLMSQKHESDNLTRSGEARNVAASKLAAQNQQSQQLSAKKEDAPKEKAVQTSDSGQKSAKSSEELPSPAALLAARDLNPASKENLLRSALHSSDPNANTSSSSSARTGSGSGNVQEDAMADVLKQDSRGDQGSDSSGGQEQGGGQQGGQPQTNPGLAVLASLDKQSHVAGSQGADAPPPSSNMGDKIAALASQIADRVMVSADQSNVMININPNTLEGNTMVQISKTQQGALKVSIETSSKDVANLLAQNRNALQSALGKSVNARSQFTGIEVTVSEREADSESVKEENNEGRSRNSDLYSRSGDDAGQF